ncbi:MAG: DUF2288 domain-containing protein [Granulosicoccus sp.]
MTIKAEDDARSQLMQELGSIGWAELVRHFARGVVINVSQRVDIVDAALCLARDEAAQFQSWVDEDLVRRASDDDARDWTSREPEFLCVVIAPWVIVQEKIDATNRTVH